MGFEAWFNAVYDVRGTKQPHVSEAGDHRPDGVKAVAPLEGLRVLLVEDSWHVAQALRSVLVSAGVAAIDATATVAEACRLVAVNRYDAAVSDVNLNGEMSFGLIDLLTQEGVPTVVVTGYGNLPELADRVPVVLEKPVRASELIAALRSVTGRSSAP